MTAHSRFPSSRRRAASWLKRAAIAAVAIVPLAFTGLFVAALSQSETALDRIPAAVVNNDALVYTTDADGAETPVFAGRQLVTELTSGEQGFDWTVTNDEEARAALAAGDVSAIVTIPHDFSRSILSLSSADPVRADLEITTDDAHDYLTGSLAGSLGESMANAFGRSLTAQYIAGIRSGVGELGSSLGEAADGAQALAGGAAGLSSGLSSLAGGLASTRDGAGELAGGIRDYTGGVDAVSAGLSELSAGTVGLGGLSTAVGDFTGGISSLAAALAQANAALQADPEDAVARATVDALSAQLTEAASGGAVLAGTVEETLGGVQSGISRSADGARRIAAGSAGLRSGADSLAGGLARLADGASGSADGAGELATGAGELADGLAAGAAQVTDAGSSADGAPAPTDSAAAAEIAADPVSVTVVRDNELGGLGRTIATFFVPLGLWVGALAVFLILRPAGRRELASTAGSARLVLGTLARASAVTLAQALLLVGLLHTVVGVAWSSLPATLGLSLLMALAFTAFHHLLTIGFGRVGLVVSLLLLAVQVTATGGLYPVQLLAEPFQWISPLLPLSHGVSGMQAILAGAPVGPVLGAASVLALFGAGSSLLALLATRRLRTARALGLVPSPASSA